MRAIAEGKTTSNLPAAHGLAIAVPFCKALLGDAAFHGGVFEADVAEAFHCGGTRGIISRSIEMGWQTRYSVEICNIRYCDGKAAHWGIKVGDGMATDLLGIMGSGCFAGGRRGTDNDALDVYHTVLSALLCTFYG